MTAELQSPGAHTRRQRAKYRRARVRNFLFTVGPSRLSRGRIPSRHLGTEIVVREHTIASPAWPRVFDGLRIGHMSDFHLGELVTLERAVEAITLLARQTPDLLACTGDFVDLHHDGAEPLFAHLAAIDAPMGSVAVLGNHDELHCGDTVTRMARDAGLIVLEDETVRIARGDDHLAVAGIGWARSGAGCVRRFDHARNAPGRGGVDLLLAHNPKAFPHAAACGVPLTLSGHTHGGQIAMKNRPNANLALSHRHRVGIFQDDASWLYVTAGVGSWFPLRVNCPAEVAVITMRHGSGPRPTKKTRRRRRRS